MKATEETKQKAKEAGISSWHLKSEESLKQELAVIDIMQVVTETGNATDEEVIEPIEEVEIVSKEADSLESELESESVDKNIMRFSIKCMGGKSPYFKYKNLL